MDEIINRIKGFNPDKIILFGSYASGNSTLESDIDLLIVQETDLPSKSRGYDIRMSLKGILIPFDIIFLTNSEYIEKINNKFSFLSSAMKTSKVLYERTA